MSVAPESVQPPVFHPSVVPSVGLGLIGDEVGHDRAPDQTGPVAKPH
jgi:hypothetical protein